MTLSVQYFYGNVPKNMAQRFPDGLRKGFINICTEERDGHLGAPSLGFEKTWFRKSENTF
ncbi:MAG: hypothetical protein ACI9UK_002280 [Candidatus Krumholzibacteriia bacterium]|jgi:hypothetical protein